MRRIPIEFEARFWMPSEGWSRHNVTPWRWYRVRQTLYADVGPDIATTLNLPPGMFSFNSASYVRVTLDHGMIRLDLDSYTVIPWTQWRETALWSEIKFDPKMERESRQWSLRWRCPEAPNNLWAKVYSYLETVDDPAGKQLRREITLHMLGASVPR